MKGYVQVDISNEFKDKLTSLRNEILLWKYKPKEEVFTFKKTPWWKSNVAYTLNIPEHLDEYFFDMVYSEKHYYFEVTQEAKGIGKLYHLVTAGNPVYLGEDLAKIYTKLNTEFKAS